MFSRGLSPFLLLPAVLRGVLASTACNNSPKLCSKLYNEVTYLGAHDSPFLVDASTGYSSSGNQYYNSTIQLAAGVRMLSAQVQWSSENTLHVCHTSCELLDAGTLSSWLSEIKTWMDSNPDEVVSLILVNGAAATAAELASEYETAGITTDLAYTPTGTSSTTQKWPTLQELITSGTRLMNFVASLSDNSGATYLMNQYNYMFENDYNNNDPTAYSCEAYDQPSNINNDTSLALSDDLMPLMNHFLYDAFFGIQTPNASYAYVTNAPSGGVGNLGSAAKTCTSAYGKAPNFILVDFFNVGPAITTVDNLNEVTNPVGRTTVATTAPMETSAASAVSPPISWAVCVGVFAAFSGLMGLV